MQAIFVESPCDFKTRVIIFPYLQKGIDIYFKYLNASSLFFSAGKAHYFHSWKQ